MKWFSSQTHRNAFLPKVFLDNFKAHGMICSYEFSYARQKSVGTCFCPSHLKKVSLCLASKCLINIDQKGNEFGILNYACQSAGENEKGRLTKRSEKHIGQAEVWEFELLSFINWFFFTESSYTSCCNEKIASAYFAFAGFAFANSPTGPWRKIMNFAESS